VVKSKTLNFYLKGSEKIKWEHTTWILTHPLTHHVVYVQLKVKP
jgi:hypothetical protein